MVIEVIGEVVHHFWSTAATGANAHPSTSIPLDIDAKQEGNHNDVNSLFDGGAPDHAQSQSTNRESSRPTKRENRGFCRCISFGYQQILLKFKT